MISIWTKVVSGTGYTFYPVPAKISTPAWIDIYNVLDNLNLSDNISYYYADRFRKEIVKND